MTKHEWDESEINFSPKVRLFRHLPGKKGIRYSRKYARQVAFQQFHSAVTSATDGVFIDLGANLGMFTRYMAKYGRQVIAFEPDPWTVVALRSNVGDLSNVEVVQAAAGTTNRTVSLYRKMKFTENPQDASRSSSIVSDKLGLDCSAPIGVQEIDFIAYLKSLDKDVDVIKIDIEGAEVDLLEKLIASPVLNRIGHIFVETHEKRIPHLASQTALLKDKVAKIRKPTFNMDWI